MAENSKVIIGLPLWQDPIGQLLPMLADRPRSGTGYHRVRVSTSYKQDFSYIVR